MMNCLIVDDEPLALAQLAGYISRIPFLKLIASCQDAHQASKVLASHTIDLLFVDILKSATIIQYTIKGRFMSR